MILISLIAMIVGLIVFLLILKAINKYILKGDKKTYICAILVSWILIFVINVFCVINNTHVAIGIPISPYFDGGSTEFFISPGYIIKSHKYIMEGQVGEPETTKFYFPGF